MKKLLVLAVMATLLMAGSAFARDRASPAFTPNVGIEQVVGDFPSLPLMNPLFGFTAALQLGETAPSARQEQVMSAMSVVVHPSELGLIHWGYLGEDPAEVMLVVLRGPRMMNAGSSTKFAWTVYIYPASGESAPVMLASRQAATKSLDADLAITPKRQLVPRPRDFI